MTDIEKIVNNALYEMYEQGTVNGNSNVTDKIVDKCLSEVKNLALLNVSKRYSEQDMDNAYDKGFKDGKLNDLRGSIFELL